MNDTITLHENEWKLADIQEDLDWCRQQAWVRQRWQATPALVHKKGGRTSQYVGQKFDPLMIDLVEDGWSHDHCAICCHTLFDSEKEAENTGWTDGKRNWLCLECHAKLIDNNAEQSPAGCVANRAEPEE